MVCTTALTGKIWGLTVFWPQCVMFQVLLSDIILGLVMILDVEYAFI